MRKLILLALLCLIPAPLWGQDMTRVYAFEDSGTNSFEVLTCVSRVTNEVRCLYSQGNGVPATSVDYAIYPLTFMDDEREGAQVCMRFGAPVKLTGAMKGAEFIGWAYANMVGRTLCIRFTPTGVVDIADGMSYLRRPDLERVLSQPTPPEAMEGGPQFPRT